MQAVTALQDTPLSRLAVAPAGTGVARMDQAVPSQRSASADWTPPPLKEYPAAVQAVADLHDTPLRALPEAPAGLGVAWMDQAVPFQASASVPCRPPLLKEYPVAAQAVADVHDTPLKMLPVAPAGWGVAWIDQLVPFHRSASSTAAPALLTVCPTAVQAAADEHDTADSCPLGRTGAGTGCVAQAAAAGATGPDRLAAVPEAEWPAAGEAIAGTGAADTRATAPVAAMAAVTQRISVAGTRRQGSPPLLRGSRYLPWLPCISAPPRRAV